MEFNMTPDSDCKEDLPEAINQARDRLRLWKSRSLYSLVLLFLGCAAVVPFLYGYPLHTYWESFGKYLVLLSMGLLVVAVYCTGLLWGAWTALRELEKEMAGGA